MPIEGITDSRIRERAIGVDRAAPATAVELAPGVYADKGARADVGSVEDYRYVFGLCADVEEFKRKHEVGGACW